MLNKVYAIMFKYINRMREFQLYYGYRWFIFYAKSRFITQPTKTKVKPPSIAFSVTLRTRTSDVPIYRKVFINAEYEIELSKEPKVIVDCGGNVGFAAVYFANRYPNATIISIEPEITNLSLLLTNIKPYSNIIPIHAALWKSNTNVELVDSGKGHWAFSTKESDRRKTMHVDNVISGITVDKIMADYSIDFIDILKIDIEGAEKEVFENVSKWINKVGVIMIELHDQKKPGCSEFVFNAAQNFECVVHKGENIFLLRKDFVTYTSNSLSSECSKY